MVNNIIVDPENYEPQEVVSTENEVEADAPTEDKALADYELPEKFKSVEDLVKSYESIEKEMGRKGQELGELRQLTQEILKNQTNQQPEQPAEEALDFYDDPDKYIEEKIKNHPKLKEAEKLNEDRHNETTLQKLNQQHPDAQQIVGSTEFQEWIAQSKVRTRLFKEANAYDFDAADELLSTWKDRQMISKTKEVESQQTAAKEKALKSGRTESRSSGESVGGKKVYRSADLIRLKMTDPDRYESMADEILRAYAEGRVK